MSERWHPGSPLEQAIPLALRQGWKLIPIYWITEAGVCACKDGGLCKSPGKHPLTIHGVKEASLDDAMLRAWVGRWPLANVALACGSYSGVDVLDMDKGAGGLDTLERLQREHGPLPPTMSAHTGSGGLHLFFQHQPGMRNSVSTIGRRDKTEKSGIDMRTTDGYVVLSPSVTNKGRYYWIAQDSPAAMPFWLRELAMPQSISLSPVLARPAPTSTGIGNQVPVGLRRYAAQGGGFGSRHNCMAWLAYKLHSECGDTFEARQCLEDFARNSNPPFPVEETRPVWSWACRVAPYSPSREQVRQVNKVTGEVYTITKVRPPAIQRPTFRQAPPFRKPGV